MNPTNLLLTAALALAGCSWPGRDAATAIDHYVAGRLALESRDEETALAELYQAVKLDNKLASAYAVIGDIYRKRGDSELAAGAYEQACQANPYDFLPHYNLGVTYQALATAAKTAEAAGECVAKAVRLYLRAVTLKPDDFDAHLNLSACYFQLSKHEQAEQYCKLAIAIKPKDPHAYSNLGIIYDAQNKPYDAIGAYKESLELDVHQPKLLLNLGSTYQRLGWLRDAVNAYKLAAGEDPASSAPLEQLGSCYFALRRWDEAQTAFAGALELDGKSAPAHRGLGVVYMAQYVKDSARADLRDKALDCWHRSLELDPRQPELLKLVEKYTPPASAPAL